MDSYEIYRKANNLIQYYGTNNPVRLAKEMNIVLRDIDEFEDLLGMYTFRWNHRIILMNPHVNPILYRMVVGHEIGHDQNHRELAKGEGLKEFELFNMTSITEYEANAFNAHLLIDEKEMIEHFKDGYDIAAVAQMHEVNINLLLIKVQEMNRLGMDFKLPYEPDPRFFRNTRY